MPRFPTSSSFVMIGDIKNKLQFILYNKTRVFFNTFKSNKSFSLFCHMFVERLFYFSQSFVFPNFHFLFRSFWVQRKIIKQEIKERKKTVEKNCILFVDECDIDFSFIQNCSTGWSFPGDYEMVSIHKALFYNCHRIHLIMGGWYWKATKGNKHLVLKEGGKTCQNICNIYFHTHKI